MTSLLPAETVHDFTLKNIDGATTVQDDNKVEVDPIFWTEKRAFLDGVGGWKIRRANAQYQKESPAFVEGKSGRGGH